MINIKPEEKSYSDITQPLAPVEDRSGAVEMAGIANTIQGVSSVFSAGASMASQQKAQDAAAATLQMEDQYVSTLKKASDIISQGGGSKSSRLRANSLLSDTEASLSSAGLPQEAMLDLRKKVEGLSIGAPLTEESTDVQAQRALVDSAIEGRWILPGMSQEQQQLGIQAMIKSEASTRAVQTELESLRLEKSRLELSQSERIAAEKAFETASTKAIFNLASNYREPTKNTVDNIVTKYNNGELDRRTAEDMLKAERGNLNSLVAQVGSGGNLQQVQFAAAPLVEIYDRAIASLDSTTMLQDVENANKLALAKTKQGMLIGDPELQQTVALSSLFNHSPSVALQVNETAARVLNQNSKDGKPADPTVDDEGTSVYLDALKDSAAKLDSLDANNTPIINIEEFVTNVDNVLKGSSRYLSEDDNPVDNKGILTWLADPQIGGAIRDNLNSFDAASRGKLTDVLTKSAENHIYPQTQSIITGDLKPEELENLSMEGMGGKVVFRANTQDPWVKSVAAKLNRQVGGALTTYFNAIGNVTGDGFSTVFSREKELLMPSQETQSEQVGGVGTQVPDTIRDGSYNDGKGNTYTVRNGIITEVRGNGN